jgi:hypothetical protein
MRTIFCAIHSSMQRQLTRKVFGIARTDLRAPLGSVIGRMKVKPEHAQDDVIDDDLILVWGDQKRIITGSDLLGRLLRGIVTQDAVRN